MAPTDPRIAWAAGEMERRLAETLPISGLAAAVNLSTSRFRHLFTREMGVAPGRYLQGLRLGRARLLLERTFLSVKQVRALVGIADPSHFTRDFERAFGFTPTQARLCSRISQHSGESANRFGEAPAVPRR